MKKINFTYFLVSLVLTLGFFFILNFTSNNPTNTINTTYKNIGNVIQPPSLPNRLTFCGEEVPLYNSSVKESLDRELIVNTYWHSSTILIIKRANRWFPLIEKILKENDVPEDFKYLAAIESNLTNTVSPAGAVGFWQLLKSTAKKYGLKIDKNVDERYNIEKSTEAACKYLKDNYKKFGSWTLAAAAYNFGHNGLLKQMKRQKSKNYYNLVLGEETQRYIFRILALKEILNNPIKFGFEISESDLYKPYNTKFIKVNKSISNLASWSKKNKINYKTLKLFNPWLRTNQGSGR
jgi:hypothetical protein